MSHHFDKKIEERAAQLQAAVEQYNNALSVMNATKEQIISLQERRRGRIRILVSKVTRFKIGSK